MLQIGDEVKVLNLSSFKNTEGSTELLAEVFTISNIQDNGILLEDCYETVLDEVFTEKELLKL